MTRTFSVTESNDFFLSMVNITIPAGTIPSAGNDCVNVTALSDTILEGSEDFSIAIAGTDLVEVTVGMLNTTTVTIIDADGVCYMHSGLPHNIFVQSCSWRGSGSFSFHQCQ